MKYQTKTSLEEVLKGKFEYTQTEQILDDFRQMNLDPTMKSFVYAVERQSFKEQAGKQWETFTKIENAYRKAYELIEKGEYSTAIKHLRTEADKLEIKKPKEHNNSPAQICIWKHHKKMKKVAYELEKKIKLKQEMPTKKQTTELMFANEEPILRTPMEI